MSFYDWILLAAGAGTGQVARAVGVGLVDAFRRQHHTFKSWRDYQRERFGGRR